MFVVLSIWGHPISGVLSGAIIVGIFYRLYFNFHVPTPVGMSTQNYPNRVDTLMSTGELLGAYYSSAAGAPFQGLLFSSFTTVAGLDGYYSLFLYPILIGVLYPLFSVSILKIIDVNDHRILSTAAVLTLVTTEGLRRAYWSRNQVIATFFWLAAIYILVKYLRTPNSRLFALLAAFSGGMAYSHRLPLIIFSVVLVALSVLTYTDRITWKKVAGLGPTKQVFLLVIFIGTITFTQLLYLGNTFNHLVVRIFRLQRQYRDAEGVGSVTDPTEPSAASEVLPGMISYVYQYPSEFGLFIERGHGIWIALVAGIAWVYLYFGAKEDDTREQMLALLSVSSVGVALMFIGVISISALNPTRPLQLIEPILVVVIVAAVWKMNLLNRSRIYQIGIGIVFILFISSQVFAMAAAPDYVNSPRYYADVPESAAKGTICDYTTDPPYTDYEMSLFRGLDQQTCSMNSFDINAESPLFNAEISPQNHSTVVYRYNVETYLGSGGSRYELTWSPERELGQEYHRVYDNEAVIMFDS